MGFDQYREDFFNKLDFPFESGKKILDVGCGDGKDAEVFINKYALDTYGLDIYSHPEVQNVKGLKYKENKKGVLALPFKDMTFDYVYMHDVLHHVDEEKQSYSKHLQSLKESLRVLKKGGWLIVVEGNRFNPLFYPHMVLLEGHNHFRQTYFKKLLNTISKDVKFKFFECHFYPTRLLKLFYVYEKLMESFSPKLFLAYNAGFIKK